jgi:hypothetical protein
VGLTVIGPLHHPQFRAASRRGDAAASFGPAPAPLSPTAVMAGGGLGDRRVPTAGDWSLRLPFLRLPMPSRVPTDVPRCVTPMRHDGTTGPGCIRCVVGRLLVGPLSRSPSVVSSRTVDVPACQWDWAAFEASIAIGRESLGACCVVVPCPGEARGSC